MSLVGAAALRVADLGWQGRPRRPTFGMAGAEVLTAFTGRGNFEMTVTIPAGSSRTEPLTYFNGTAT